MSMNLPVEVSKEGPPVNLPKRLPADLENVQQEEESRDDRFHRILAEYGPALMRLVSSYEYNHQEAEDLYQEICLAVCQALGRFRGDCSERTFVYRVAHNKSLTHRGRKKPASISLDDAGPLVDTGENIEVVRHRIQRQKSLLEAIRQLPEIQRQIVTLRLEGLPQKEIAEVVGTTENNIAVRLNRARKALKSILELKEKTDG
jgi:RNA polymerase sigma factor (sigma-70 family)